VGGQEAPLRRESFAVSKLDLCLSSGLALDPNTDDALTGRLRRAWTGVKHIRFD
jgi:hypothetical protein